MRALSVAFLALFFGLSALPLAARGLKIAEAKLFGVTTLIEPVDLSWPAYRDGKFQESFEASFDERLGFRTHAIRADNELNLRVFRQLGYDPHTGRVLGKDDYIYDRVYVDSFNRRDDVPIEAIEPRVKSMLALQRYMESRGKTLLVLITPSKAVLYPEYLPRRMIDREQQRGPSNYHKLLILLQRYGVHYFDAQGYLAALKGKVPFTLFPNSGIHWGDPAACEVSARVLERIGEQLQRRVPRLQCEPYRPSADLQRDDTDVLDVCNLWSPERLVRPGFYA
ncbi:MAG TPA: hypothetical protein VFQ35_26285, partial [Polyangiaceae bacterium]|nr:hypothetical protein [Polyangiaceae bacterium]